ncbi:iron-containing redox enzyme family protein [Sulfoacidibacillus thermotolerans]|uniref:iron-containing redox enzyme family protein n=1 Tax=Sulfoacidibacillus thermotolerans TaxID=1765684 RepID=UPI0011B22765|nr:iron-containing redox enzyme family protein [Sulfoacidibacillus thermotolerans]
MEYSYVHQEEDSSLYAKLHAISELDSADATTTWNLFARAHTLCDLAFFPHNEALRAEFHLALSELFAMHSAKPHTWLARNQLSRVAFELRKILWERYFGHELTRLRELDVDPVPENPDALVQYLKEVNEYHIASNHPVFSYLCDEAPLVDVKSFFYQEGSVDARFDDLIALAQIGLDGPAKDEYAENFADEMGHGDPDRVHTTLFEQTSDYVLGFCGKNEKVMTQPTTEALACSNIQLGMAYDRRHTWRLAGYLAAFELNAPKRCEQLVSACTRHGMKRDQLGYLTEHIDADVGHAEGLFDRIIKPLALYDRRAPVEIAQGFLLRLQTSADYCDAQLHRFLQSNV